MKFKLDDTSKEFVERLSQVKGQVRNEQDYETAIASLKDLKQQEEIVLKDMLPYFQSLPRVRKKTLLDTKFIHYYGELDSLDMVKKIIRTDKDHYWIYYLSGRLQVYRLNKSDLVELVIPGDIERYAGIEQLGEYAIIAYLSDGTNVIYEIKKSNTLDVIEEEYIVMFESDSPKIPFSILVKLCEEAYLCEDDTPFVYHPQTSEKEYLSAFDQEHWTSTYFSKDKLYVSRDDGSIGIYRYSNKLEYLKELTTPSECIRSLVYLDEKHIVAIDYDKGFYKINLEDDSITEFCFEYGAILSVKSNGMNALIVSEHGKLLLFEKILGEWSINHFCSIDLDTMYVAAIDSNSFLIQDVEDNWIVCEINKLNDVQELFSLDLYE